MAECDLFQERALIYSARSLESRSWLAAENLMLAAHALGLGTCVIGCSLAALNAPDVKAELSIPSELSAIAPVIVGVPAGETPPTTRKEARILAWK
jgi:nitroreductase